MTTISAKMVAHSVSEQGIEIATMQLRYPKLIHAEAKTHRLLRIASKTYELLEETGFMDERAFSRNASSSRAIPVKRMIEDVLADPVRPVYWGKNQQGMQAREELKGDALVEAQNEWERAMQDAIAHARRMADLGAAKEIVNRIIETYAHINVVVTSTEWANFFALRRHIDAQPEIRALAHAMHDALKASTPVLLHPGEWHVPYVLDEEIEQFGGRRDPEGVLRKLSVARNARVSYLTHEGRKPDFNEDLALHSRLIVRSPLHASPAEHQATPDAQIFDHHDQEFDWMHPGEHANFVGWRQYRKMLPGECVTDR